MPWTKHVIARNLTARDNVCLAACDIMGDGLVELAVGVNWNPGDTLNAETSSTSFDLQRPAEPTTPGKPIPLEPHGKFMLVAGAEGYVAVGVDGESIQEPGGVLESITIVQRPSRLIRDEPTSNEEVLSARCAVLDFGNDTK